MHLRDLQDTHHIEYRLFTNTEKLMLLVYITENCIEWWNPEILLSAPESTRTLPSRESIIQEF